MAQTQRTDALHYLANRPLTPFATLALQVVVTFVKWEERRRTRIALSHLDKHLLRDIGIEAQAAQHETRKPFWQY